MAKTNKTSRSKAKKSAPRKAARTAARKASAKSASKKTTAAKRTPKRRRTRAASPAVVDVRGADMRRDIGGVRLEVGRAGSGRVKRMIYPAGFKWSTDIKPHVGTDHCMHAHVGFLVSGRIDVIYSDGCVEVYEGPQIVAVAPGHDGHVVGDTPAVLIEFDFESDTLERFGMPAAHTHD
jgi:hypothetical protein